LPFCSVSLGVAAWSAGWFIDWCLTALSAQTGDRQWLLGVAKQRGRGMKKGMEPWELTRLSPTPR